MSLPQWEKDFYKAIAESNLSKFIPEFSSLLKNWKSQQQHNEQKKWQKQLDQLPVVTPNKILFDDTVCIGDGLQLDEQTAKRLKQILHCYRPWRKGPFKLFNVQIDTEWRSDFKWNRIKQRIPDLTDKNVLDVGCGSGYHLFRMHQSGARIAIGVDPTPLFFYQFQCIKKYVPDINLHYLPVALEKLPSTSAFDVVFCMGVLYHRVDPLGFLKQLKAQLNNAGSLVLETLIIEGSERDVLMPKDRYAQMSNVYFIPSREHIALWLNKVGFKKVTFIEQNYTTIEEQRTTEWMPNHSLENFLDPNNSKLTIEGYPAPLRATFIATK